MIELQHRYSIKDIRGIVFDWSGVVVDEIEATGLAHIDVIKKLTGKDVSYEEWRAQIGSRWQDFYLKHGVNAWQLPEVLPQFQLEYQKFRHFVMPQPGIFAVLSTVKQANYMTAVLSNQKRSVILESAWRFNLLKYFDLIVAADDLEKTKPHPEALLQTLRLLQLHHREVILLEDMKDGIQMGLDVGTLTIGVRSKLEQDLSMANCCLENVIDLLEILGLSHNLSDTDRQKE